MTSTPTGIGAHTEWTSPLVATHPPNSSATRIRKARQIHMRISWIMLFGKIWLTGPLLAKPVTAPALFAIVVRDGDRRDPDECRHQQAQQLAQHHPPAPTKNHRSPHPPPHPPPHTPTPAVI